MSGPRNSSQTITKPQPAEGEVTAPAELSDDARAIWDQLAPDLIRVGVLTTWDVPAFVIVCEALARYRQATKLVNGSALLVQGTNGFVKNPALLLWIKVLRQEAIEARNDPSKENAFRQYRLNQWVAQSHRWMPMHLYRRCTGTVAPAPDWLRSELAGRRAYAGLGLAAKLDFTAWALVVPDGRDEGEASMLWRFWLPQAAVNFLDQRAQRQGLAVGRRRLDHRHPR